MSLESYPAEGCGIFEVSGISDMQGLTKARDKLIEYGINVTDGGHDLVTKGWLIETVPSISKDKINKIAEEIGLILRSPLRPT